MTTNHQANAALVEALGSALREGEHGLTTAPKLLLRILREQSWREFVTQRGEQVRHARFERFVTMPPLKGLGSSTRLITKIVDAIDDEAERVEARDLLDQALAGRQGERTDLGNIVTEVSRPEGNSQAKALRRLRKDRPDLHDEVLAGRLTAHAAMIQAGFRRKTVSVPVDRPEAVANTLRKNLSPEHLSRLIRLLDESSET